MKILAFDTTNTVTSVAISEGQTILAYAEELKNSMQAERLIPMIEEALSFAGLSYEDIDILGVTNGPGSFTGIRVGLASAKGILLATKIKGIAVTNFDVACYRAKPQVKNYDKIFILLNAFREQTYVKIYDKDGSSLEPILTDNSKIMDIINANRAEVMVCSGSGLEFVREQLEKFQDSFNLGSGITLLPRFGRIKALHICRYLASNMPPATSPIEPLYIRFPDAVSPLQN